jgi:hypothetical protein
MITDALVLPTFSSIEGKGGCIDLAGTPGLQESWQIMSEMASIYLGLFINNPGTPEGSRPSFIKFATTPIANGIFLYVKKVVGAYYQTGMANYAIAIYRNAYDIFAIFGEDIPLNEVTRMTIDQSVCSPESANQVDLDYIPKHAVIVNFDTLSVDPYVTGLASNLVTVPTVYIALARQWPSIIPPFNP